MAHNIDMSNNRANMAFVGSRSDIWHGLGQQMKPGMSLQEWLKAAGLDWKAIKTPALARLSDGRLVQVADRFFMVRDDTWNVLGGNTVSDVYQAVQPLDVGEWFERYVGVDDRFGIDTAMSLNDGATIAMTATFREPLDVAGQKHIARLLMTTTYDGSGATINQGTTTRVVCNNTLHAALGDKRSVIRTRHNTRFDAAKVGRELGAVAQGFAEFKKMGDALAQNEMSRDDVSRFFKQCLDIPFEAKPDEISTRKRNQFGALKNAYFTSVEEGAPDKTAWAALQAVTRYVDHDRSGKRDAEASLMSAQFGSGAALKATAVGLLLPRIADRIAA